MDLRTNQISKYTAGIADIKIGRHPLRQDVQLIFNTTVFDIYQDSHTLESERVNKKAIVKKDPDMDFVQELLGTDLVEDVDKIPWLITLTTTGLPRIPKMDDQVVISGIKYNISKVKPINRNILTVLTLLVYPERSDEDDALKFISAKFYFEGEEIDNIYNYVNQKIVVKLVVSGNPQKYSFDSITWYDYKDSFSLFIENEDKIKLYLKKDDIIEVIEL